MKALAGKRIVITRAAHQAGELEQLLLEREAIPLLYPCIAIEPPQDSTTLDRLLRSALSGDFDWLVITSTNSVRALKQRFDAMGVTAASSKLSVAAVGSTTAREIEEQLGLKVSAIPEQYNASALAYAMNFTEGAQMLMPQSEIAEQNFAQSLSDMGAKVTTVVAYQTVIGNGGVDLPALLRQSEVDAIIFTSGSTVVNLLQRLENEGGNRRFLAQVCIACIGAPTATIALENNLSVKVIPSQSTAENLVTALERYYAESATGETSHARE